MSLFPAGEYPMGHCGAEILNWFTSNKCNSYSPEGFETALFQMGF
jgi:hypothetical protein